MHYYKFNVAAWAKDTSHLTLKEEAIYLRLINYYYDTEKPIPIKTQLVLRKLRMGDESEAVKVVLDEFFVKTEKGWEHNHCNKLVADYQNRAERNRRNGKNGGRPKNNDLEKPSGLSVGKQVDTQEKPTLVNQELLTTNYKLETNSKDNSDEVEKAFKVFYSAGMRKLNPKGALKSFTALCKKQKKQQTPMDIANHLVNDIKIRLANNQMGFDKMHPTTYLNGERWNDERLQESNATANSQGRNSDPMAAVNAAIARREQQRNNQRDEQAGLAMENRGRTLPHEMD